MPVDSNTTASSDRIVCPSCQGKKQSYVHLNYGGTKPNEWRWVDCLLCDGKGEISREMAGRVRYGEHIREDRKRRLKTLRQEAADLGCTPYELSQVESGRATKDLVNRIMEDRIAQKLVSHAMEIVKARAGDQGA